LFLLLMAAGFGSSPEAIGNALTWRQMQHFAAVSQRRKQLDHADQIEAIAMGMGAKDLQKLLRQLRA